LTHSGTLINKPELLPSFKLVWEVFCKSGIFCGWLFYLCGMTDEEIVEYFKTAILPDTLRLDRASTQHDVKEYVPRNIELILNDPKNTGARHRLLQIINALEHPYDGSGIPGK
jgi:hypothetical protein